MRLSPEQNYIETSQEAIDVLKNGIEITTKSIQIIVEAFREAQLPSIESRIEMEVSSGQREEKRQFDGLSVCEWGNL